MTRILVICCLLLMISACQTLTEPWVDSTGTEATAITAVTLNHDFPIRGYRSNEYIQGGEIQPYESIQQYNPYCKLELREIADTGRIIKPETFNVTRVHQQADFAGFRKRLLAGDGSSGLITSTTYLFLESEQRPDIFRLSCSRLDESFYARQASVGEMQDTLGNIMTLQL